MRQPRPATGGLLDRLSRRRRWVGTREPWTVSAADFPAEGALTDQARFLVRYAVLAPSSHNTQPWLFTVEEDEVHLFADLDRWLTVADHDKRELYLSLGAALENLLVAAAHFDLGHEVRYLPGADSRHVAAVKLLRPGASDAAGTDHPDALDRPDDLFDAITERRTVRGGFEDRPVALEHLRAFRAAATGDGEGSVRAGDADGAGQVGLQYVTDVDEKDAVADLVTRADRRLFADYAYRRELGRWIGRGAFGDSWLRATLGRLLVTWTDVGSRQASADASLVRNSPVLGVLRTRTDDPVAQVRAGQAFERVALLGTTLGIRTHPVSAPLETPTIRQELTDLLGDPAWPVQHLFRLGYADADGEPAPRRGASAVLLD